MYLIGLDHLVGPEVEGHIDDHGAEGNEVGHKERDVLLEDSIAGPDYRVQHGDYDHRQVEIARVAFANYARDLSHRGKVRGDRDG